MSFDLPDKMIKLNLWIPAEKSPFGSIELNEDLLNAWVKRLPMNDPVEVIKRYVESLDLFNHNDVKPRARLNLLEIYRPPLLKIISELSLDKVDALFDKHEEKIQFVYQTTEALTELATGYKTVVLDSGKHNDNLKLNSIAQFAIYRSIEVLSIEALNCFRFHQVLPKRLLCETHQLLLISLEANVEDKEPFVSNHLNVKHTIKQRYTQFILTTLCNPYAMRSGEVFTLYELMLPLVNATKLELLVEPYAVEAGCFYIDCINDRTPTPANLPKTISRDKPLVLILQTKKVLHKVHQLIDEIENLDSNHPSVKNVKFLKKFIPYFNTSYTWKQPYVSFEGDRETYITPGLKSIHQTVTQGTVLPDPQHKWLRHSWEIVNKNDYGYLIQRRKLVTLFELRVGDILGVMEQGANGKLSAKLCQIKWLKTDDFDITKISLELIDGNANAVTFTSDDSEEKQPAFLLAESHKTQAPASMITAKGVYEKDRILHIKMRKKILNFSIKLDKPLPGGSSYERFTFKDLLS